ncbi:MAG: hypothetical protein LBL66_04660 [Clostridiales bacterium]|jgi:hypothetical protein|nr:hypothetical protein [Clostridiales bacterium]
MNKRLERRGKVDLKFGDQVYQTEYFELITRGDWIYYDCLMPDKVSHVLLRFDFYRYQVSPEPLKKPVDIKNIHRQKFVPAADMFYYLKVFADG